MKCSASILFCFCCFWNAYQDDVKVTPEQIETELRLTRENLDRYTGMSGKERLKMIIERARKRARELDEYSEKEEEIRRD